MIPAPFKGAGIRNAMGGISFHLGPRKRIVFAIDANMMRDMVGGAGCGADGANPLAKMLQGVPKGLFFVQNPLQTPFYRLA